MKLLTTVVSRNDDDVCLLGCLKRLLQADLPGLAVHFEQLSVPTSQFVPHLAVLSLV